MEIGAGTGVCSLFLGLYASASKVICNDGSDVVVELIKRNIDFNGLREKVEADKLRWSEAECKKALEKYGKIDVIFGTEIAYNENCVDGLSMCIDTLLSQKGRFVIGHIERYHQVARAFLSAMQKRGFETEKNIGWDELMPEGMINFEGSVIIFRGIHWDNRCFSCLRLPPMK